jgi:predicted DNA-binding transcriptional regulator YafY
MRLERKRENVLTLTATSQELSALVAAARLAYGAMQSDPNAISAEALEAVAAVLRDYDRAREKLNSETSYDSRGP